MEPKYNPKNFEENIYRFWQENNYFYANVNKKKKPFVIILPPPNANADLHLGHAMYVYEDIMIRFYKLKGYECLWLPGADHAGFETQFVFEKYLKKQGKSRINYQRDELYQMIWDFVMKNRDNMENQLKKLGFALDWSKKKFTLDEDIIKIVYQTFEELYKEKLIYREKKLINYCTFCGTSFSDLEVVYKEKNSPLYYLKYHLVNPKDNIKHLEVATTRPETLLGDTALAVNPKDNRYKKFIGEEVYLPLIKRKIKIIADEMVDKKFGTGVVKITPAHDFNDFEVAKRHNLEIIQAIEFNGKISSLFPKYQNLYIKEARKKIIEDLEKENLLSKVDENYQNRVGCCYKCGNILEPLPKEQWFIKIRPLAKKAKKLVIEEKIKIYPKRFKKILLWWYDNFKDWNISRQIVWGIKIPAYYCQDCQKWFVDINQPKICQYCQSRNISQDQDTFDTWFSSGQWPYATLMSLSNKKNNYFNYFYPTTVMETGYDILPWWVARMIMLGYFFTKRQPFINVFLHGLVRDRHGQKMSKSKGNVINPMEMINKYGADALRMALIFGTKEGNDIAFYEEKVIGMRNFCNKIWNIGRFININNINIQKSKIKNKNQKLKIILEFKKEFTKKKRKYLRLMKNYQFSQALGLVYDFLWHRLADFYIEQLKKEVLNGNIKVLKELEKIYLESLKLLHPFAPFISEAIWKIFKGEKESLLKESL